MCNAGIELSFRDIETSGQMWSDGGTGKTTAETQTASTFLEAGWDFVGETENGTEDIWWILEGQHYPRLWWQYGKAFSPYPRDSVVDDFESYDAENQVWFSWHDGLGYGAPPDFYLGNRSGSVVGDETWIFGGHMETVIVHGGRQSMPYAFDNNKPGYFKYSEAEKTLSYPRNWSEGDVTEFSLWFRGNLSNDSELMYVAIANKTDTPSVIYHDDPNAVRIDTWTEWIIPLQTFTNQGIDLSDVDRIAIGFGTRGNLTIPCGRGKMYFDDIRLYRPRLAVSDALEVTVP